MEAKNKLLKKKIEKNRNNLNNFKEKKLKNIYDLKLKECSELIISITFFFEKFNFKLITDFEHPFILMRNGLVNNKNLSIKSVLKDDFILMEPILLEKNDCIYFNLEAGNDDVHIFSIKMYKWENNNIDFSKSYLWVLNNDFIIEIEKKTYNYKFLRFNYSIMNEKLINLRYKESYFKFFKNYFNYFLNIFSWGNIFDKESIKENLDSFKNSLIFFGNGINLFMDYKIDKNDRLYCYVFHPSNNLYQWEYFEESKNIKILKTIKIIGKEIILKNLKYLDNVVKKNLNFVEICYKCKYKINKLDKYQCEKCQVVIHQKCLNINTFETDLKIPCVCNDFCCFCEINYEKQNLTKCRICQKNKMHSFCILNKTINSCKNCYLCKFCGRVVLSDKMEILNQNLFCDKECINEYINKENCNCCNEQILNKKQNNIVCKFCNSNYNYQCLLKVKNISKYDVNYCISCSNKLKSDQILFILKIFKFLDRFDFFMNPLNENSNIYYSVVKDPIFISYMFEKNEYYYYNEKTFEKLMNDVLTLEKNIKIYNMPDTPAFLEGYMFIKLAKYFINNYKNYLDITIYEIMVSKDNRFLLQHSFYRMVNEIYENLFQILFEENTYKISVRNINLSVKNNIYYKYANEMKLKDLEIYQLISEFKFLNINKTLYYDIIFNWKIFNFNLKNEIKIDEKNNGMILEYDSNELIKFIKNIDDENTNYNILKFNLVNDIEDDIYCFYCCCKIYEENYLTCNECGINFHNNEINFLINGICIFCVSCDICKKNIDTNNIYVKCNLCKSKIYHVECYYEEFNKNIISINYKDYEIYLNNYLKNSLCCFECFKCFNCDNSISLKFNKNNCIDIFLTINVLGRVCLKCSSIFRKQNYCYLCYKIIVEKDEFTGTDLRDVSYKNYRLDVCKECKFPMHLQCFIDNILNLLNIPNLSEIYDILNKRLNNFKCNCYHENNDNFNEEIIIEKEKYENYLNKYEFLLKILDNLLINKKKDSNKLISKKKLYSIFFTHNHFYNILKENMSYNEFIKITSYNNESIQKIQKFLDNINFSKEENYIEFLKKNYKDDKYIKKYTKNIFFDEIENLLKNTFNINKILFRALKKYYSNFKQKIKDLYLNLQNDYLDEFKKLLDYKIEKNLKCLNYENENINYSKHICNICLSNKENKLYGKIIYHSYNIYSHINCLKWLDGIYTYNDNNFKLIFNYENILDENKKRICNICTLNNAQITCQICKIMRYHIKCSIGKCLFIFNQSYKIVCKNCLIDFVSNSIYKKLNNETISKLLINNDQNLLGDPFDEKDSNFCYSFNYDKTNFNKEQGLINRKIQIYNSSFDINLIKEEYNEKKFYIKVGNYYLIPYNFKTNQEETKKEIALFKIYKNNKKDKHLLNKIWFPELKLLYVNSKTNEYKIIYLNKKIIEQVDLEKKEFEEIFIDLFKIEVFKYDNLNDLENNINSIDYEKQIEFKISNYNLILKILKIETIHEYIKLLINQKITYINKIMKNNFEINMNFNIFEPITYSLSEFELMYNEKKNSSTFDKSNFIKLNYNNHKFEENKEINNIQSNKRIYNTEKKVVEINVKEKENQKKLNLQINFLEYLKDPFKDNFLKSTNNGVINPNKKKIVKKDNNDDFEFLQNRLGDYERNKQNYEFLKNNYLYNNKQKGFVMNSKIHKYGYISNCFIKKFEFISEYIGEIIREMQASQREILYQKEGFGDCYMFSSDKTKIIDATYKGNEARYLNHSCDPNCASIKIKYKNLNRIILFAIKDIAKGEELTFDYNFELEEEKLNCLCGADKCKGRLN